MLPHQAQYLEAFQTLCEWRGYTGLGDLAPLTLADMNSYFSIYRVESLTERENLLLHIKALDMLFLKSASEKKAEASKSDVR